MPNRDVTNLRQDYQVSELDLSKVDPNPIVQFNLWFVEALKTSIREPNAMTIATVNSEGQPSCRIILLKELKPEGFIFYTNYDSTKGKHLAVNPKAALNFFWDLLERQVRVEGLVEKISAEDSDKYFYSRPEGSQLGAIASPQSQEVKDRAELESRLKDASEREIKRPGHWGGYILKPEMIEFWQGRSNRMHDRIQYRLEAGEWSKRRLAP